jgi:hypothetical protein
VGLVQGKYLSVDGSFVEANAAKESRIPREQLVEAAHVHHSNRIAPEGYCGPARGADRFANRGIVVGPRLSSTRLAPVAYPGRGTIAAARRHAPRRSPLF